LGGSRPVRSAAARTSPACSFRWVMRLRRTRARPQDADAAGGAGHQLVQDRITPSDRP
jgi:hypothetical protein